MSHSPASKNRMLKSNDIEFELNEKILQTHDVAI